MTVYWIVSHDAILCSGKTETPFRDGIQLIYKQLLYLTFLAP